MSDEFRIRAVRRILRAQYKDQRVAEKITNGFDLTRRQRAARVAAIRKVDAQITASRGNDTRGECLPAGRPGTQK